MGGEQLTELTPASSLNETDVFCVSAGSFFMIRANAATGLHARHAGDPRSRPSFAFYK